MGVVLFICVEPFFSFNIFTNSWDNTCETFINFFFKGLYNILTYYMYACSLYCKTLLLILHCTVSFNHGLIIYRTFINDQHKCSWGWKKKRIRKTILSAKYPDLFCLENCHSTSNYESLSNRKMLNTIINMMDDFYHKQ